MHPPMPTVPSSPELPRYLPEIPFPAYAYVPGRALHPASSEGHLAGRFEPPGSMIDGVGPTDDAAWLRGIDLFNHGYYWEAHEVWEAAWKACGKQGVVADFIKALIKLAACGVKVREGRPVGVKRHAAAARRLLETIEADDPTNERMLGLSIAALLAACDAAEETPIDPHDAHARPRRVFDFVLWPD